jgi:hypothetical protein
MPNWRNGPPALTAAQRRALIIVGGVVAAVIWLGIVVFAEPYDWSSIGTGHDARPYWTALFDLPYATSRVGAHDAYLYSPAFLQVIAPLRALPWQGFVAGWTLILIGAVLYLVGPVLLGPFLLLALPEILGGNITLLIAAAIVAGFRFSGTWAFPLLTKVTPGLGLLWFFVRREWRALAVAVVTTVGIAVLSFVSTSPADWLAWPRVLAGNAGAPIDSGSLPVPLFARLPIAAVVTVWAARTDRRWALVVACLLALPVIWYGSLTLLIAIVPLARPDLVAWSWGDAALGWRVAARSRVGVRRAQSA